jgi:hypothetical protein
MMPSSSSKKRDSSPPSEQAPDLSITADDNIHLHAAGYNESPERGIINGMARFRSTPLDFFREVSLYMSGTGWRSYDNIIGQPVFYNGFSEKMKNRVLSSPLLVNKVRELASKRVDVEEKEGLLGNGDKVGEKDRKARRRVQIEESLMEVADSLTDNMICKMESKRFIRGAYYLATQLLTRAYHQGKQLSQLRGASFRSLRRKGSRNMGVYGRGANSAIGVHVSSEEVLRLRKVAEEAAKKNQSIIFLPCHRSHVDYVRKRNLGSSVGVF